MARGASTSRNVDSAASSLTAVAASAACASSSPRAAAALRTCASKPAACISSARRVHEPSDERAHLRGLVTQSAQQQPLRVGGRVGRRGQQAFQQLLRLRAAELLQQHRWRCGSRCGSALRTRSSQRQGCCTGRTRRRAAAAHLRSGRPAIALDFRGGGCAHQHPRLHFGHKLRRAGRARHPAAEPHAVVVRRKAVLLAELLLAHLARRLGVGIQALLAVCGSTGGGALVSRARAHRPQPPASHLALGTWAPSAAPSCSRLSFFTQERRACVARRDTRQARARGCARSAAACLGSALASTRGAAGCARALAAAAARHCLLATGRTRRPERERRRAGGEHRKARVAAPGARAVRPTAAARRPLAARGHQPLPRRRSVRAATGAGGKRVKLLASGRRAATS
jgi:hypothetical protein